MLKGEHSAHAVSTTVTAIRRGWGLGDLRAECPPWAPPHGILPHPASCSELYQWQSQASDFQDEFSPQGALAGDQGRQGGGTGAYVPLLLCCEVTLG